VTVFASSPASLSYADKKSGGYLISALLGWWADPDLVGRSVVDPDVRSYVDSQVTSNSQQTPKWEFGGSTRFAFDASADSVTYESTLHGSPNKKPNAAPKGGSQRDEQDSGGDKIASASDVCDVLPRGPGSSCEGQRQGQVVALDRKKVLEGAAGSAAAPAGSDWVEPDWAELTLEKPEEAARPFKILFIGVNANESATIDLLKEFEAIENALKMSECSSMMATDRPVVKQIPYSTWSEVMEEVRSEHPSALHFGLHSNQARGIELFRKTVQPEKIVAAIRTWNNHARKKSRNEVPPACMLCLFSQR
jgi:hypothetical protein